MAQNDIERLIYLFSKIPGLGPRSARRAILYCLKHRDSFLTPFVEILNIVSDTIKTCYNCGNLDTQSTCSICTSQKRDKTTICVVESVADLWAMERGNMYKGSYLVLGGTLSALDSRNPESLNINKLFERINQDAVQEVIIATNATLDGQTTAYYITERLQPHNIKITRLAYGIPIGGELDYLDEGTLNLAFKSRQPF